MSIVDLRNPGRAIHAGVILMNSETEILDVAPIDLLHGMTPAWLNSFPDEWLSPQLKKQAIDIQFHWVNESGKPARITSGMTLNVTVSPNPYLNRATP